MLRAAPRTRTRRLPCSITARTYTFALLSNSAVKKFGAKIPCARDRRNSAQPGPSRHGAGPIPASLRIRRTAAGATAMPGAANSPWMRRQPRDPCHLAGRPADRWLLGPAAPARSRDDLRLVGSRLLPVTARARGGSIGLCVAVAAVWCGGADARNLNEHAKVRVGG